jgi:hypothetical protein
MNTNGKVRKNITAKTITASKVLGLKKKKKDW